MENEKLPPLSLVLRRFENECLELLPANAEIAALQGSAAAACRITAKTDGNTQIYRIFLPESLIVCPVDWRRFAYNHAKVVELLACCVRDNFLPLHFEPWSEDLKSHAENTMTLALGDLSSIFDLKSVHCEHPEGNRFLVSIEGEHKNGEISTLHFPLDL